MSALFAYAKNAKGELGLSVVLSVVSILLGLVPFFCMYRVICLFAAGTAAKAAVISWCAWSLAAYAGKVLCFTLSTGISHHAAYNILEGLRLRLVERFSMHRWARCKSTPSARSRAFSWTRSRTSSRRWPT